MDTFDYQGLTPKRIFPDEIDDSFIGKKVMYRTEWKNIHVPYEHGVITSYNQRYVFIDFNGRGTGQACAYHDTLLSPTSCSPHICSLPKI